MRSAVDLLSEINLESIKAAITLISYDKSEINDYM